jgi:hypothetical protein
MMCRGQGQGIRKIRQVVENKTECFTVPQRKWSRMATWGDFGVGLLCDTSKKSEKCLFLCMHAFAPHILQPSPSPFVSLCGNVTFSW